jgi:hypothetical protein
MSISKAILIIIVSLSVLTFAGCWDSSTTRPNNNTNTNAVNSASKANANSPVNGFETVKAPEANKTNDAQSVKPVIMAYYEALKKKDDAALRKVYTAAAIKELEAGMKTDGQKSLVSYIEAAEPAGDTPFEIRNEKVEGDTATAEIKGGSYAVWTKWKFVKENGEWKLAPPSENIKF